MNIAVKTEQIHSNKNPSKFSCQYFSQNYGLPDQFAIYSVKIYFRSYNLKLLLSQFVIRDVIVTKYYFKMRLICLAYFRENRVSKNLFVF